MVVADIIVISTITHSFPSNNPGSANYFDGHKKALTSSSGQSSDSCCSDVKKSGAFLKWQFIHEGLLLVTDSSLRFFYWTVAWLYENISTSVITLVMKIIIKIKYTIWCIPILCQIFYNVLYTRSTSFYPCSTEDFTSFKSVQMSIYHKGCVWFLIK